MKRSRLIRAVAFVVIVTLIWRAYLELGEAFVVYASSVYIFAMSGALVYVFVNTADRTREPKPSAVRARIASADRRRQEKD